MYQSPMLYGSAEGLDWTARARGGEEADRNACELTGGSTVVELFQ